MDILWFDCLSPGAHCSRKLDSEIITSTMRSKRLELVMNLATEKSLQYTSWRRHWRLFGGGSNENRTMFDTFEWRPSSRTKIGKWLNTVVCLRYLEFTCWLGSVSLGALLLLQGLSFPSRKWERAPCYPTWVNIRIKWTIMRITLTLLIQCTFSVHKTLWNLIFHDLVTLKEEKKSKDNNDNNLGVLKNFFLSS